jgi:type IV pilus assembly protein PilM
MLTHTFRYPIAIDMGCRNIYAVQFQKTRGGLSVREMLHRELDVDAVANPNQSRALRAFFIDISRDKGFSGKKAVLHLPPQHILSVPIRFRLESTETVEAAILRTAGGHLPFPVEAAIIDYPYLAPISPGNGDTHKATIIAVNRDHIDRYLPVIEAAGLSIEAVDFAVSSLARLHQYLHPVPRDPIILCNVGHTQSMISAVTKESILAHRNIPWGTGLLLDRIQANLEPINEYYKAKALLRTYGLLHDTLAEGAVREDPNDESTFDHMRRAVYQIIAPLVDELIYELHKTIGYLRSEHEGAGIEEIHLYGQAASVYQMEGYVERRVGVPTRVVNPLTRLRLNDDAMQTDREDGGAFSLALGLGMRKVSWL